MRLADLNTFGTGCMAQSTENNKRSPGLWGNWKKKMLAGPPFGKPRGLVCLPPTCQKVQGQGVKTTAGIKTKQNAPARSLIILVKVLFRNVKILKTSFRPLLGNYHQKIFGQLWIPQLGVAGCWIVCCLCCVVACMCGPCCAMLLCIMLCLWTLQLWHCCVAIN